MGDSPAFPFSWVRYGVAMRTAAPLLALMVLAACGASDTDPGPGGVTVGEAKALDEAAEMLDQRRLPPEALPEGTATPAQGIDKGEAGE